MHATYTCIYAYAYKMGQNKCTGIKWIVVTSLIQI